MRMTKAIIVLGVMIFAFALLPTVCLAETDTDTAAVTVTITSLTTINLTRDPETSVTRGSANNIILDRRDDQEPPQGGTGDPGFMYAPYRSEPNMNWHVASVATNGSTMTLSTSVTGSVGATPLSSILKLWCGGFFLPGSEDPIEGTESTVWEFVSGWQRQLSYPFTGTVPFNYQLSISGLASGSATGTITYTLTSTTL